QREPSGQQAVCPARQPAQPHDDADAYREREPDEQPALPPGGVGQKAERGAHVVDARDVQYRQHRGELELAVMTGDVELGQLVRDHDERGQRQPPRDPEAPLLHRHANLRSSPGPSTLTTQRAQSSGCLGSTPTSARRCQQRTHFGWLLGMTSISTPSAWDCATSGSGASVSMTRAWLVISKKRNSSSRAPKRAACSGGAEIATSASSGAPIAPAVRSRSSSRATSALSAMNAGQSIGRLRSAPEGNSCQVFKNTDSLRSPGRNLHTSSAVKLRMGASQRTIASAT